MTASEDYDNLSVIQASDVWVRILVLEGVNDLLLVPGAPACILHEGAVQPIGNERLESADIESAVLPALGPHAIEKYRQSGITDSSYSIAGLGRFRINLHHEQNQAAAAI